jgi:hypothetical protein
MGNKSKQWVKRKIARKGHSPASLPHSCHWWQY